MRFYFVRKLFGHLLLWRELNSYLIIINESCMYENVFKRITNTIEQIDCLSNNLKFCFE